MLKEARADCAVCVFLNSLLSEFCIAFAWNVNVFCMVFQWFFIDWRPRHGRASFRPPGRENGVLLEMLVFLRVFKVLR